MNQSPNSLRDTIRIANNLDAINIIGYDNRNYVIESNLLSFMEDNSVESIDGVISIINEFCGIKDISIITESESDEILVDIREAMYLLEALDANEVINTSKGPSLMKEYIDRAAAFITGHKYDKADELRSYIKKCDRVLEDISEERSKAKEKNSSYKFSLVYIYNLAKLIFNLFIAPFIITKAIKWPAWVTNLVNKLPFLKHAKDVKKSSGIIGKINKIADTKPAKVALTANKAIDAGMPEDIKGLYLSFKDYNKLLDYYETKIKNIKSNLESQLEGIESGKTNNNPFMGAKIVKENSIMYKLEEEVTPSIAASVHYVSPEELQGKPQHREVFHDNGDEENIESPESKPEELPTPVEVQDEPEFTPLDAIDRARANPSNVMITKYNDNYYVDHKDLKGYMHACDNHDYDSAVDCIVKSHADPEMKPECVKVVMGSSELENCSPEERSRLESAQVEFEIYSER